MNTISPFGKAQQLDPRFDDLLEKALAGEAPDYGVVIRLADVRMTRFDQMYRPETTEAGTQALAAIMHRWSSGTPVQPWLYVQGACYIFSDDYLALAAIERGQPASFAVQILGEPLSRGLIEKFGPLGLAQIRAMLGITH
jgi:hypothetical protein